jgi:hypothetical protein
MNDDDSRVMSELSFEVLREMVVELDQDEPGVRVHALDDAAGMAAFARAEFHHGARRRKVDKLRGLPSEKR